MTAKDAEKRIKIKELIIYKELNHKMGKDHGDGLQGVAFTHILIYSMPHAIYCMDAWLHE